MFFLRFSVLCIKIIHEVLLRQGSNPGRMNVESVIDLFIIGSPSLNSSGKLLLNRLSQNEALVSHACFSLIKIRDLVHNHIFKRTLAVVVELNILVRLADFIKI